MAALHGKLRALRRRTSREVRNELEAELRKNKILRKILRYEVPRTKLLNPKTIASIAPNEPPSTGTQGSRSQTQALCDSRLSITNTVMNPTANGTSSRKEIDITGDQRSRRD